MSHFKWYSNDIQKTVPFNASYRFPTEATRAEKMTPRIPPKNGGTFNPGDVVRLEFPAQGYSNLRNTTIAFDLTLTGWGNGDATVRMQNDIQSIFSRVRVLYGGNPLEDISDYNGLKRLATEWTCTNGGVLDQETIAEGIGGQVMDIDSPGTHFGHCNVRQKYVQGYSYITGGTPANFTGGQAFGRVGQNTNGISVTKRYSIQLATGLHQQKKLIPTKWMASQFAVELTLEQPAACIYSVTTGTGTTPTYKLTNVALIPEILSFDIAYDEVFEAGMIENGVAIPFASWHRYGFVTSGNSCSLGIQEKSRSVKSIFTVQKRNASTWTTDSGAAFFDTAADSKSTLQSFQYRVGGRYFPAAPVECASSGSAVSNGGAEAFVELQKALGTLGDFRLSSNVSSATWAIQSGSFDAITYGVLPEHDYSTAITGFQATDNQTLLQRVEGLGNAFCGTLPSASFCMATNLETSDGAEISGLNAEEQSDISLIARWSGAQAQNFNLISWVYYDAMLIVLPNNDMKLVE